MARILLIEDDPEVTAMIVVILEGDGHATHALADGRGAVEACEAFAPDIVITDILMPEQEGIETIISIRRARPDLKILAISGGGALGRQHCLDYARMSGASEILEKPFEADELRRILTGLLDQG